MEVFLLPKDVTIIFLSPAAQGGGAEAALTELLRALREARPDWHLHLVAGEEGPLLAKACALGVPGEALPFPAAVRALGEGGWPLQHWRVRSGRRRARWGISGGCGRGCARCART